MTTNDEPEDLTELDLTAATGLWAVRSSSPTVYYLDLDRRQVFRARAPGSGVGAGDNAWCPLVSVKRLPDGAPDVITTGARHRYVFDPDPAGLQFQWWIQRTVLAIEQVASEDAPPRPPQRTRELP